MEEETKIRTISRGAMVYLAPCTNPWFHWFAFGNGGGVGYSDDASLEASCHHSSPMCEMAVSLELARVGMADASWSRVAFPPQGLCPFGRPEAVPPSSVVYFVQAGRNGPIKIGTTNDIARRLTQLQIGSPEEIMLVGMAAGDGELEDEWHQRFDSFRLRGEWFKPDASLLTAIAGVTRVSL